MFNKYTHTHICTKLCRQNGLNPEPGKVIQIVRTYMCWLFHSDGQSFEGRKKGEVFIGTSLTTAISKDSKTVRKYEITH